MSCPKLRAGRQARDAKAGEQRGNCFEKQQTRHSGTGMDSARALLSRHEFPHRAEFPGLGLSLTDFTLLEALLHKGSMTITEIRMLPYLGATRQHIVDYENHRRRLETGKCPHHGTGCNRRNLLRVGGDLLSQSCKRVRSGCQPAECGCEAFGSSPLPALPHQGRSSRGHNQGPNCPEHSAPNVPQLSSRLCLSLIF
jgi:hypothetical protein